LKRIYGSLEKLENSGGRLVERCGWAGSESIYKAYHDQEWGVPVYDSRALWEKLVLDGFQAGLSWITILKKRDNFRSGFAGFDPSVIADWGEPEVLRLLDDSGIIRHRGKIEATITNAQAWTWVEAGQGFDNFLWEYVGGQPLQNQWQSLDQVPTKTPLSEQVSKDLEKAGFRFCGPTITHAFMQAMGMINDHLVTCPRHGEVARLAR
jgi:DNA-3-methyladenine glycosylase I